MVWWRGGSPVWPCSLAFGAVSSRLRLIAAVGRLAAAGDLGEDLAVDVGESAAAVDQRHFAQMAAALSLSREMRAP